MPLPLALPQAHSSMAHPHCAFCRRTFYDDDGEWQGVGRGCPNHAGHAAAVQQESYYMLPMWPPRSSCAYPLPPAAALWKHMHQVHYSCHVCPPPMGAHAYFNRAPDLMEHMR